VLSCLPEKSREVLVLFYIEDYSYREALLAELKYLRIRQCWFTVVRFHFQVITFFCELLCHPLRKPFKPLRFPGDGIAVWPPFTTH